MKKALVLCCFGWFAFFAVCAPIWAQSAQSAWDLQSTESVQSTQPVQSAPFSIAVPLESALLTEHIVSEMFARCKTDVSFLVTTPAQGTMFAANGFVDGIISISDEEAHTNGSVVRVGEEIGEIHFVVVSRADGGANARGADGALNTVGRASADSTNGASETANGVGSANSANGGAFTGNIRTWSDFAGATVAFVDSKQELTRRAKEHGITFVPLPDEQAVYESVISGKTDYGILERNKEQLPLTVPPLLKNVGTVDTVKAFLYLKTRYKDTARLLGGALTQIKEDGTYMRIIGRAHKELQSPSVLFLNSFYGGAEYDLQARFNAYCDENGVTNRLYIQLDEEYNATETFGARNMSRNLHEATVLSSLYEQYKERSPSVIICAGVYAADFLARNYQNLFASVPVIVTGIPYAWAEESGDSLPGAVTGKGAAAFAGSPGAVSGVGSGAVLGASAGSVHSADAANGGGSVLGASTSSAHSVRTFGKSAYAYVLYTDISAAETASKAVELFPHTKKIVLLNTLTPTGKLWAQEAENQIKAAFAIPSDTNRADTRADNRSDSRARIRIEHNTTTQKDELSSFIRAQGEGTVIICGTLVDDDSHTIAAAAKDAKIPVFGLVRNANTSFQVGGKYIDSDYHLQKALNAVDCIINGIPLPAATAAITNPPVNQWAFNYTALTRFVSYSRAKPFLEKAVIENKPLPIFRTDIFRTVLSLLFLLAACALSVFVFMDKKKYASTQKELTQTQQKLSDKENLITLMNATASRVSHLETNAGFYRRLIEALKVTAAAINMDHAYIWSIDYETNTSMPQCSLVARWSGDAGEEQNVSIGYASSIDTFFPNWNAKARYTQPLTVTQDKCGGITKYQMATSGIVTRILFPITTADKMWGFACFDSNRQTITLAADTEQSIFTCMRLIAFRIIEHDAEHGMNEAKAAAEAGINAKSTFLANMSHEVRTPLNAIMGMSELMLMDSSLSPKVLDYVTNINASSRNLLSIINDILDFSKIESGKLEIIPSPYDFIALMDDVISILRIKSSESFLSLFIRIAPDIPRYLIGDEIRVKQILLNLLTNAIKYTKEGSVTLTVSNVVRDNSVDLIIEVQDTGIGIKKEDQERMFMMFERLDTTRNRDIEGTGLGLAITKQLCTLMDGSIEFTSEYGNGSTFTAQIKQSIQKQEPIVNLASVKAKSILVYEPRRRNRRNITIQLADIGIRADISTTPQEFTDKIGRNAYDFIFVSSLYFARVKSLCGAGIGSITGDAVNGVGASATANGAAATTASATANGDSIAAAFTANGAPVTESDAALTTHAESAETTGSVAEDQTAATSADGLLQTPIVIIADSEYEYSKSTNISVLPSPLYCVPLARFLSGTQPVADAHPNAAVMNTVFSPDTRVLVVDDNIVNQQVAIGLLSVHGIKPVTASSGFDALEILQQNEFDLIFMDHLMPEMDGIETTHEIRLLPNANRTAPIIALTANAINGVREKFLTEGMNDFLPKPIIKAQFDEILDRWLPQNLVIAHESALQDRGGGVRSAPVTVQIPNLDTGAGLSYAGGSLEAYTEVLKAYAEDAGTKNAVIRNALSQNDLHTFTVHIHALKSASRTIGAKQAASLAAKLEKAGTAENRTYIDANIENCLTMIEEVVASIKTYLTAQSAAEKSDINEENVQKLEGSEEVFAEKLRLIKEAAENYDILHIQDILQTLNTYRWQESNAHTIEVIASAADTYNYEAILTYVNRLV